MKLLIAAVLASASLVSVAQMSPTDAFNAGKEFANGAKSDAAGNVNSATGQSKLPYYSTNAPESQNFQGGRGAISGVGQNKMVNCANSVSPDGFKQQECDAVNFLAKNPTSRPKYVIDKRNDPIITGSKNVIANPGTVPGAKNQQCRVEKVKNPATYLTETCTESQTLDTIQCKRGFSANVGTIVDSQSFDVNRGSEVPTWSARTFPMTFNVAGSPEGFKITWYQADNYGQVWINGTLVYQNVLGGYGDMRNGSVATEIQDYGEWSWAQTVFKSASGNSFGSFYDDGCNWGCRGTSPNLDVTQHIREGDNEILLVCANAAGIGPCSVKIVGTAKKLVMLGSLIDNQCASLEQRAK